MGRSTNTGVIAVGCVHLIRRHAEDADSTPRFWLIDPELICQGLKEEERMNSKAVLWELLYAGWSPAEPNEYGLTFSHWGGRVRGGGVGGIDLVKTCNMFLMKLVLLHH